MTNAYGADGRVQAQTDAVGKTTRFSWDPTTETAVVTDANGGVWRHDYDEGVLAREIDPLGEATELDHDVDLNTVAVISPSAERSTMTYDAAGNLLAASAPASLGSVQKTFAYNSRNDPAEVTDARGTVTSYTYTPAGNTETVRQGGLLVASYAYDAAGRVLSSTDGNGKTTTYSYAPTSGYLASVTDPLGNETTYTYDGAGRVATRVDPKGNVPGSSPADFRSSYTYDEAGRQLTEVDPLGHVTTNVYDDAGMLVSTRDANGHATSYGYDDAGRVVTETAPDPDGGGPLAAPVTTYAYDGVGNKVAQTDPRGSTTSFAYDAANRLVSETGPDPDGSGPLAAPVTTHAYDANGNLTSTVEPRGNMPGADPGTFRTTYAYDAAGRLLRTTDPLGHATVHTYDAVGNLASARDANGHVTSYTHDGAGRVLTATAPDLGLTAYSYDDAGNLLTRRDANGHTTAYRYDDAGQLVAETSPDPDGAGPRAPAVTSYTYDANGNRLTVTDPNGNATAALGDGRTTYAYDRASRVVSIDHADQTPDVALTYDAAGNRLTMSDGTGTESRRYDALDRLVTVSRGQSVFSYAYDASGNVTRRAHPGGVVTDYAFDALDRLSSVTNGGQRTTYAYDAGSNLVQTVLPAQSGVVETRAYDRAGRLTDVSTMKGTTVVSRFLSTLDAVGNPLSVVRTGSLAETLTYGYDANDRLVSVCFQAGSCPGASDPFLRWAYDKVGNRVAEQRPGSSTPYVYDARDRLLAAGTTSYGYDENGNALSAGSRTFAYDLANRVRSTTQAGTTTTYAYDGDGVRLQASTGPQASRTTDFLWEVNGGLAQIASERDGNGKVLRRYVYGVRRISQTAGNSTSYFAYDGLGSVASLVSSTGGTQRTWSYEPFGAVRIGTKASGNQAESPMRFAGEYLDPTGLYHLRARQYDPGVGRFLSLDPAEQSSNDSVISGYVYAADRPTIMVDPSGEVFRPAADGIAGAWFITSVVDWTIARPSMSGTVCGGRPRSSPEPSPCGVDTGTSAGASYSSRVFLGVGHMRDTHTLGNWQSDRAVDIAVPVGTRVCAVFAGKIGPRIGPLDSSTRDSLRLRFTLILGSIRPGVLHASLAHRRAASPSSRANRISCSGTRAVDQVCPTCTSRSSVGTRAGSVARRGLVDPARQSAMSGDRVRRSVLSSAAISALVAVALLSGNDVSRPPSAGAASAANDYTLVLRDRAGPYHYWRTLTEGRAYQHAIAAFGRPSARGKDTPESNVCTVRWETRGIDVGFAWAAGPCRARNLGRTTWAGMRLFGSRWKTSEGLRVGDPVARIRRVYPKARFVSRPPTPGEWWLVAERKGELGAQPLLVAEVGAGRVIALRVPPARF